MVPTLSEENHLTDARQSGLLSGQKTIVFIDNHDTQRSKAAGYRNSSFENAGWCVQHLCGSFINLFKFKGGPTRGYSVCCCFVCSWKVFEYLERIKEHPFAIPCMDVYSGFYPEKSKQKHPLSFFMGSVFVLLGREKSAARCPGFSYNVIEPKHTS